MEDFGANLSGKRIAHFHSEDNQELVDLVNSFKLPYKIEAWYPMGSRHHLIVTVSTALMKKINRKKSIKKGAK